MHLLVQYQHICEIQVLVSGVLHLYNQSIDISLMHLYLELRYHIATLFYMHHSLALVSPSCSYLSAASSIYLEKPREP